jgi:hypothetical protein
MDRIEDGSIQITDEDFPLFLYTSGTVYDEDNEDLGLFQGFLLVHVYRHIFTGPLSAINPSFKANKYKAKKINLTQVTRRTIAYASVQVCFILFLCLYSNLLIQAYIALSSMSQWGLSDNLFNLEQFYDNIVVMFEKDPEHPWVIKTLDWWNE